MTTPTPVTYHTHAQILLKQKGLDYSRFVLFCIEHGIPLKAPDHGKEWIRTEAIDRFIAANS
jgi:hypothetical protein